jgi:hypothetical protein
VGKLLVLVLGIGVVGASLYLYLQKAAVRDVDGTRSEPARALDNVRSKARDFEVQSQKNADDLMKKSAE